MNKRKTIAAVNLLYAETRSMGVIFRDAKHRIPVNNTQQPNLIIRTALWLPG
jgi:hypothetical protein